MRTRVKICAFCQIKFFKSGQLSWKQWDLAKFCSRTCRDKSHAKRYALAREPLKDVWLRKVLVTEGCWLWQGATNNQGYGVFSYAGKQLKAHIVSLQLDNRAPKLGELACHHCDNPSCVRPDHLYPGSPQDNANDAVARGRLVRGESHHSSKLNTQKIREMRRLHRETGAQYTEIARRFGVSRPTATRAITGKTWGHIK